MALSTRDGFYHLSGPKSFKNYAVDSTTVVTAGDVLQIDEGSGDTIAGATGATPLGVAQEASASGSTTPISVLLIEPGQVWEAKIETGTMANSEIGDEADINSSDGITLTESNGDVRIVGWDGTNTDLAYVTFNSGQMAASGRGTG